MKINIEIEFQTCRLFKSKKHSSSQNENIEIPIKREVELPIRIPECLSNGNSDKSNNEFQNINEPHVLLKMNNEKILDNLESEFVKQNSYEEIIKRLVEITQGLFNIKSLKNFKKGSLKNFNTIDILGIGGEGTVFLIQHKKSNEANALKLTERLYKAKLHAIKEKSILLAIQHPNICKFYACYKTDKCFQFVMECFMCGTLRNYLDVKIYKQLECIKIKIIRFITLQILMALHYLHECNVAHRDLKPANVGIDAKGYIKLCDFGHADKFTDETGDYDIGSRVYAAPEIKNKLKYDHRVDIYSLGEIIDDLTYFDRDMKRMEDIDESYELLNDFQSQCKLNKNQRPHSRDLIKHDFFKDIDLKKLLLQEYNMTDEIEFDNEIFEKNSIDLLNRHLTDEDKMKIMNSYELLEKEKSKSFNLNSSHESDSL